MQTQDPLATENFLYTFYLLYRYSRSKQVLGPSSKMHQLNLQSKLLLCTYTRNNFPNIDDIFPGKESLCSGRGRLPAHLAPTQPGGQPATESHLNSLRLKTTIMAFFLLK